jgi:flagellin-like hook-associated protein FlgL
LTLAATNTVQDFLDAVNNGGIAVKAELSSDGRILLEATGANSITIGGTAVAGEKLQLGLVDGLTAAGTVNASRTSLATQYASLRTQIDQLARDAGFNGVNLLNGDGLKVVFNETNTSSLSISGVTYSSTGLGITAAGNNFQTDYDINVAIGKLSTALNSLRSQAASFGSSLSIVQNRQDFTRSMINTLQTGADNLVLADSNEEGANLLALQTRQQLSTTTLSLAAQAAQNVLRLFQ